MKRVLNFSGSFILAVLLFLMPVAAYAMSSTTSSNCSGSNSTSYNNSSCLQNNTSSSSTSSNASYAYCKGDYVVPGGVKSPSQVVSVYKNPRVSHVYKYFGINSADMANIGNQAVNGTVTKAGDVYANGRLVAKNAISAGCGYIPGSSSVNDGYMTFYTRPTSVSFASTSLSAFVVMRSGQFSYAILKHCGNPVMATPVTPPAAPSKKPSAPAAPVQAQTQSQTVTVTTPPEVESAVTTSQPAQVAQALPNTGPGNVFALAGATSAIGTLGHWYYNRRRRM